MREKKNVPNVVLAGIWGTACLVGILVRAFWPGGILPGWDLPGLVLVSLTALVISHFLAPGAGEHGLSAAALAALTFGLLPWAGGLVTAGGGMALAAVGGLVFWGTAWLYRSMLKRLPGTKAAAIASALGLYLAVQGLTGML